MLGAPWLSCFKLKMAIIREYLISSLWALFAVVYLNRACDCFRLSTMGFLLGFCQSQEVRPRLCAFWNLLEWLLESTVASVSFLKRLQMFATHYCTYKYLNRTAWPYSKLYSKCTDHCITRMSCALTSGKYILLFVSWIKTTLVWVLFPVLCFTRDCVFVSETRRREKGSAMWILNVDCSP